MNGVTSPIQFTVTTKIIANANISSSITHITKTEPPIENVKILKGPSQMQLINVIYFRIFDVKILECDSRANR